MSGEEEIPVVILVVERRYRVPLTQEDLDFAKDKGIDPTDPDELSELYDDAIDPDSWVFEFTKLEAIPDAV